MSKAARLAMRACLLLVAWQWAQHVLATPCKDGELRVVGKDEKKCCPRCIPDAGGRNMCQNITDRDCRCLQGFSCVDNACLYCEKLPECAEGEELVTLGAVDFTFECKPCEKGTYSNVKNGWCRYWTDCEGSGFLTIKPGNSTHNALCGVPVNGVEQVPVESGSLYTMVLAVLTAVALFVLILLTFLLHFCIWSLRKDKDYTAEDVEYTFPGPLLAPPLLSHREETYSCQFPEEERGEKTAEEKPFYLDPQSLQ